MNIDPAKRSDLEGVRSLLTAAELPLDGVEEHLGAFLVARDGDVMLGCIGMEAYGPSGLLRSLVVGPAGRGRGTGRELVEGLLGVARHKGIATVYLLTTTAEDYFPRFGFEIIDRSEADERLKDSAEFRGACPDSAVCMRLSL